MPFPISKVILDADLAKLYGVTSKRPNQQVKRNSDRFTEDFMFRITQIKKNEVVANCNHLIPVIQDGRLDWSNITEIEIVEIIDTH